MCAGGLAIVQRAVAGDLAGNWKKSEEVGYLILGRALPEGQKPAQRSQNASVRDDEEAGSVGQDQSVRPHHALLMCQEFGLTGLCLIPIFCTLATNEI